MKIFTFWAPKNAMPPYIKLCIETWIKFIPDADIHILDLSNVLDYVDIGYYGKRLFSGDFSLPQISDAIRSMVLEKYGGIWMDTDTIILKSDVDKYTHSDKEAAFFGYPGSPDGARVHLAYINAVKNSKLMQNWVAHNGYKIYNLKKENMDCNFWSYLGNSIVNPYIDSHPDDVEILDVIGENCMPEIKYFNNFRSSPDDYVNFYFKKNLHLSDIQSSMLMLHNSWTPEPFKKMSAEEFLSYDCTISNVLSEALDISF